MADNINYEILESILAPQTQALQQIAMRPQKSWQTTSSTSTETPYALANMIANRDRIGTATQELNDALKEREGYWYRLGSNLSNVTPTEGYGSWASGFLRGLGGGLTRGKDLQAERLKQKYENEMKDLAEILAYDTAMGGKTTQYQRQEMDYKEMPYGTAGSKTSGQVRGGTDASIGGVQENKFGRSVGYDPVANVPNFGPVVRAGLYEDQMNKILSYFPLAQSAAKAIRPQTATEVQTLHADISDNILSGRVLDFVSKAGGIRVADTPAEQEFIFGPIRNYKNMSRDQLKSALEQSRNNFVAAGMNKVRAENKVRESRGEPLLNITEDDFKQWYNSAFTVPKGKETRTMYNIQDIDKKNIKTNNNKPIVGEVRNGIRFLGYNDDGSMKFERVK